jgi:outer membrane protein OmpA-like peptidoglycan-associated protein
MRAEAVKAVLVGGGAPPAALTTAGVGAEWPRHVPNLDANGVLLPALAAQNRMVLIELTR